MNNKKISLDEGPSGQQFFAYNRLVPNLEREQLAQYYGICPFCGGRFSVYLDEDDQRWRWWCKDRCRDSRICRRNGRDLHGGSLTDLRRKLICQRVGNALLKLLRIGSKGLALGIAILEHASQYVIDITEPFGVAYSSIAEIVPGIFGIDQPDGSVRKNGYAIKQGIKELAAVGVEIGNAKPMPGRQFGTTTYSFATILQECEEGPYLDDAEPDYDPFENE